MGSGNGLRMRCLWLRVPLLITEQALLVGGPYDMAETGEDQVVYEDTTQTVPLPRDVRAWLESVLDPGEVVVSSLFADIAPTGEFGEQWVFLTNTRLLVLSPDADGRRAKVQFEQPLDEMEGARLQRYIGSSALIVTDRRAAYEVARFSLSSHHEASLICHRINESVRRRKEGEGAGREVPPPPRRPTHRCPNCGRALRRQGEVCPHCVDRRKVFTRLFYMLLDYRWHAIGGLAFTLSLTVLNLTPPYLTKVLVDEVIKKGRRSLLPIVVALLMGVHVSRAVIGVARSYVMQWLGNRLLFDMRVRLFNHLQMLPLAYYNQKPTGQIMSRVTNDVTRIQNFIVEGFQEILVNVLTIILIAIILLSMNPVLFAWAMAPIPIIIISTVLFGRHIHLLYHRIWRRVATISAILGDTIPGIRVVKSFAQENRESQRFTGYSQDLFSQQMRAVKLRSAFFPFLGLMTGLGSILIFGVGGYMVLNGDATLGTLMAFTAYLWQLYMPIQRFGMISNRLQQCETSAERVFEVMDTEAEALGDESGHVLSPVQGRVEFRDVRFAYEPGKYALNGVSFVVEPGEMIGLVGPSGAGKSTLVQLIMRFYEVDEGQILIDDVDVMDLALRPYREQIGVVLQEPYLFKGTVWENIAYAKPDATADEVIAAARAANSHDFIMKMPDGYDTVIGERGQSLSGGERQRISIARAVLRAPRILILDEATDSVDTETEMLIQRAIEHLVKGRTTFAIAHRLSTLRKADRLIVLERGELAEMGTHNELLHTGGLYSRLCRLQSELSKMKVL